MSDKGVSLFQIFASPPARIPDGTPGIRDVDAPCDAFGPGDPGGGRCDTDGHYICAECVHMSAVAVEWKQDQETELVRHEFRRK